MKRPTTPKSASVLADIRRLAVTYALALATGWLFLQAGMPAPYLMGSLFGVWFTGAAIRPLQAHLGVARWFHVPVILGLGVLIGATFNRTVLAQADQWFLTLATMIGTTLIVTTIGYNFLRRIRGYPRPLAFLCSVPGGQAEVIAMARDLVREDYAVALFHLVRVAIVFISTPLLLGLLEGSSAVSTSNARLQAMPGLFSLPAMQLVQFAGFALVGYVVARLCRIPMPHLVGPMGLSTAMHLAGWADIPRINEFVILAQLAIGGAVGARLAQVPFRDVMGYLRDALANTLVILTAYLVAALVIIQITGADFLSIWLAFVPGGLYEVTLLALVFGFDVAFVAFHHTVRVLMIFLSFPGLAGWLKRQSETS